MRFPVIEAGTVFICGIEVIMGKSRMPSGEIGAMGERYGTPNELFPARKSTPQTNPMKNP